MTKDFPNLPSDVTIEFEVRIIQNHELLRKGISALDSEGKPIDYIKAGISIQRTSYELLKAIWNPEDSSSNSPSKMLS